MDLDLMSPAEAAAAFNWLVALTLFVFYSFVQAFDSSLTLSITRHKSVRSAHTTFLLYIIWGIEVFAFISNYLYIIPMALGGWLGTYLLIEREKKVRPLPKSAK
jgi:hypothetical protein